jgi:beta-ribofuranosylaminobenzene 5'-phosphate synthase
MACRVAVGARLHVGFTNLSLSRARLYGGIGLALDRPETVVTAERATSIEAPNATVRTHAERIVDRLDVPGATVHIESSLPRHVGLGSGTRLALAVARAIAGAYDQPFAVRKHAPALGRGGRSGVGVATFEDGGFVVDAGHPSSAFTVDRPDRGDWEVPPVAVRRHVPSEWRFVIAVPGGEAGRSGEAEDDGMRRAIEAADPAVADRVAGALVQQVLPGLATGDVELFGAGVEAIDRANGEWYADLQGGIYRPPAGQVIEALRGTSGVAGVGQSSWGPAVWALTTEEAAEGVANRARQTLETHDRGGTVHVVQATKTGAAARNV